MKLLITGGAGFIGSHFVDRALADGHEVVVLDNFDSFYPRTVKLANVEDARRQPRFRLVELDLLDAAGVSGLVHAARPDAIVHLAAKAGVRPSLEDPSGYVQANVTGTANLLEAARALQPMPRFVFASSSSVYGERTDGAFRETDPVDRPISPYAATKRAGELLLSTFHQVYGLPSTALRFFTAYGPRNRPDLAIAKFARLIEAGRPIPMYGDGSTLRDYTYIADIVDGIARAVGRCPSGSPVYNLGNSSPIALRDMIEALGRALGKTPIVERHPPQPGDVSRTCADVTRAAAELGYHPSTPLDVGLGHYVAWLRRRTNS